MRIITLALWLGFAATAAATGATLLHACGITSMQSIPRVANFCPSEPLALSTETDRGDRLRGELARLQRELADKERACAAVPPSPPPALVLPTQAGAPRPQQTAALRPPPPPPQTPVDLDAERWNNKDLSVLEGCWRLGHDTALNWVEEDGTIIETNCTQRAGRLCFDANGNGINEESGFCPSGLRFDCRAPMSARFDADGTIVAEHPKVPGACNTGPIFARWYNCQRVDDTKAVCTRRDRGGSSTLEFRR
jgi:hypothetical protein